MDIKPLKSFKILKEDLGIPLGALIGLELDVLPYSNYIRVEHILKGAKFADISERIKTYPFNQIGIRNQTDKRGIK